MQCTIWNTATVEQSRRFDYYRSALCDSFAHLTPHKPAKKGSFSGVVEHWSGSCGELTLMATSTHCVSRSRSDIAKVEDDHFYLNFIQRGEMKLEQFGSRYVLKPGDMVMIDNAHIFEAQLNAYGGQRHLAFQIGRQRLPGNASEITRRLTSHELTPVSQADLDLPMRRERRLDCGTSRRCCRGGSKPHVSDLVRASCESVTADRNSRPRERIDRGQNQRSGFFTR